MKRTVFLLLMALLLTGSGCAPSYTSSRPNYPHDNGRHKGWYKHGHGRPPGQAKKTGMVTQNGR